jgi:hypothetical protein
MNQQRTAMQMALEALLDNDTNTAFTTLREALAQPQDNPKKIVCPFCTSEFVPAWLHDLNMDWVDELKARAQPQGEPVAEVRVRPLRGDECAPRVDIAWLTRPTPGFLYTTPPSVEAAIEATKEKAAKAADLAMLGADRELTKRVLKAIRSMK